MNLVIDIGNSYMKLFVFERNKIVHFQQNKIDEEISNKEYLFKNQAIKQSIVCSVSKIPEELIGNLYNISKNVIILDHQTPIPIRNLYQTPETLGKDRIAGIVGAYNIYKHQNVLAIDSGTALTFDLINKDAEYLGGNISPGLQMRFKALNTFTKKLPLVDKEDSMVTIGTTTREAIIAGVQGGMILEIDGFIEKIKQSYQDLKVILTGGDTFFFAHKLKNTIFAEPNLVAIGLNFILQYNAEKN